MKSAYDNRTNGFVETSAGIDFAPDRMSAEELRLVRTKEAIFQKLKAIFGQHGEKPQPRSGRSMGLDSGCPMATVESVKNKS